MDARALLILVGIFTTAAAWGGPGMEAGAEAGSRSRAAPSLVLSASAGAMAGLDRLLRGAEAGLELGLSGRSASGDAEGLGCGLLLSAAWDRSLNAAFLRAGLSLGFGPSLSLEAAWELPLSEARLEVPEAASTAILEPAGIPCRLAARVVLARLGGDGRRKPLLLVSGSLSWTSYRVAGTEGGGGQAMTAAMAEALAGSAGFAAGFRASACLVLAWTGPLGPPAGRP